jgi:hypothetical protein
VEAVSNTSTVTLRVVGGGEKESLKSETVKYQGTRTRERLRWQGPAAYKKDTTALSSERNFEFEGRIPKRTTDTREKKQRTSK